MFLKIINISPPIVILALDKGGVPHGVKVNCRRGIAFRYAARLRYRAGVATHINSNLYFVAAEFIVHRVQRLVDIADEVHREFERFGQRLVR